MHSSRPDLAGISYTQNWPHEPLIDNTPTADAVVWSVVSFVLLLAGVAGMVWYFGSLQDGGEEVGDVPFRLFYGNVSFANGDGFESWFSLLNVNVNDPKQAREVARSYLLQGLKLHPQDRRMSRGLARLELQQGRRDQALEHLRPSLEELPADPDELAAVVSAPLRQAVPAFLMRR